MLIELLTGHFEKKLAERRIDEYFNKLSFMIKPQNSTHYQGEIIVSCVQRKLKPVKSIEDYIDMLHELIRKGVNENSELIIFPEYNFFDLLGIIPGFRSINCCLNSKAVKNSLSKKRSIKEKDTNKEKRSFVLNNKFAGLTVPIEKSLNKIMSMFAKAYGIYIYSGSYILYQDEKFFNAGTLYGPDGRVIGTQKKLHLTDMEDEIGIQRGKDLASYKLPIGNISTPICMDATYFETFKALREAGSDIAVLPIANMEEYNMWKSLRGIWPRVQEAYVYGLKASLNGWLAGMHFTGKAGIFAPVEMTADKDGVIAMAPHYEGNYVVTAAISISELTRARENAQYHGDCNVEFERGFFGL